MRLENMNLLINLAVLLILGFILGYERARSNKVIGARSVTLILLGAFTFTFISTVVGGDPARIIAQVVSGVGFIGAGIVFKDGVSIRNLTTAILVWLISAIGCLLALSLRVEAIAISTITYLVLKVYPKFKN